MWPKNKIARSPSSRPSRRFACAEVSPVTGTELLIPIGMTVAAPARMPKSSTSSRFIASVWTKMWSASRYWILSVSRLIHESLESRLPALTLCAVSTIFFPRSL